MPEQNTTLTHDFQRSFLANERRERINTGKVAALLVVFLMPAGMLLDKFIYPDELWFFLFLRLLCSGFAAVIWYLYTTPFGEKHYQFLGLPIALLPIFFMSWMIYVTEGPTSTYYAGLNLVLLAVSVVVRWNIRESFLAVAGALLMYAAVSLPKASAEQLPIIFNNFYFLSLTGIIVVVGNYFFNQLRLREFTLRYQLDRKKEELESSNTELSHQKQQVELALDELKKAQDQLVQAEKQASLGRMSGGIIHEINNPINFISTGLYVMRSKEKLLPEADRAEFKEVLQDVEEGVNRVKSIVTDLRTFAHPGNEPLDELPVADVVNMAKRFVSGEIRDVGAELVINVPATLTVRGSRNKLVQVLVNLLQNSLDAVAAKSFSESHATIWIEGRDAAGHTVLVIRDNGVGIAAEHLDKIYDPFFTTKDIGKGMGLGLSICYRIVGEFDGTMTVRTEAGQFCEFTLDFPPEEVPAQAD